MHPLQQRPDAARYFTTDSFLSGPPTFRMIPLFKFCSFVLLLYLSLHVSVRLCLSMQSPIVADVVDESYDS